MENFNKFGWMIAVIIAIIAPSFYTSSSFFGGSTDSGYNATADGVYAVDGTTVIDGSGNWVGAITGTTGTISSTLAVTATTTLSDTVNFDNPVICINFYATSTATRMHMTASSTSLVNGVSTGVMLIDYGACAL